MMTTMKSSATALFLAVLLARPLALAAAAVKVDDKPMFPDPIDPSGMMTITGNGFTGPVTGSLFDLSQKETKLDSGIVVSDKTVTFRLPPGIAPGRYVLRVSIGDLQDYYVPGEVRIGLPEPKLESAYPPTVYRDDTGGFTFALNGQNLPKDPADVAVVVDGVGNIIPASAAVGARLCAERVKGDPLPCVMIDDPGRRVVVRGYSPQARAYQGAINVRVPPAACCRIRRSWCSRGFLRPASSSRRSCSSARWLTPSIASSPAVERLNDSKPRVTVNTGPAGTARLKISAPSGSTSVDVKVE
jgi:hypothetical protein